MNSSKNWPNIKRRYKKSKPKTNQVSKIKFVRNYISMLPKLDSVIKKHISLLHSDDALKILFLSDFFYTIYKRNKNLKKIDSISYLT